MKPKFCNEMCLTSKLCLSFIYKFIFNHYLHQIIILPQNTTIAHTLCLLASLKLCPVINLKNAKYEFLRNQLWKNLDFFAGLLLVAQAKSVIAMKKAVSNVKDKLTTHKQRVMDNSTRQSSTSFGRRRYIWKLIMKFWLKNWKENPRLIIHWFQFFSWKIIWSKLTLWSHGLWHGSMNRLPDLK